MNNLRDDEFSGSSLDSWDLQTQQIHWPIGAVLMSEYAPALRALGLLYPDDQRLGKGGFGVAYRGTVKGRDSVIKLTRDPMEVVASWSLRGRATKHVVPIYEVWSLPKMQQHGHWASWWAIHRGYLHPFRKKDDDLLETIFDFWKDDRLALQIPKSGDAGRSMREKWRSLLRRESSCTPIEVARSVDLLDQISRGIRELGQVGIDWTDILPDNLKCDSGGQLRVADVGFGRVRRDIECEPPELTVELARAYVSG